VSPLLAVFRVKTLTTYLSSCVSLSPDSHDLCFLLSSSSLLCLRCAPNNLFHFCYCFLFFSRFLSDFSSPLFIRYTQLRLRYAHPNFLFFPPNNIWCSWYFIYFISVCFTLWFFLFPATKPFTQFPVCAYYYPVVLKSER